MQKAEARIVAEGVEEAGAEGLVQALWRLRASLPLEAYFQAVEDFIDQARERLQAMPDEEERRRLRAYYSHVIETAVNLGCGFKT
jgi:hypothetical protein